MAVSHNSPHLPATRASLTVPKSDSRAGPKSHVFQPPRTPTPSRPTLTRTAAAGGAACYSPIPGGNRSSPLYRNAAGPNRDANGLDHRSSSGLIKKRGRQDSSSAMARTATTTATARAGHSEGWGGALRTKSGIGANCGRPLDSAPPFPRAEEIASPEPFVNTSYFLKADAQPISTPAGRHTDDEVEEAGFRRRWSGTRESDTSLRDLSDTFSADSAYVTHSSTDVSMNGGGSQELTFITSDKFLPSSPNGTPRGSWTGMGVVVSLVGRMWSFCNGAFRGFYAGGGTGYAVRPPFTATDYDDEYDDYATSFRDSAIADSVWQDVDSSDFHPASHEPFRSSTPIPGAFPRTSGDFDTRSSPVRPAKRLHTDATPSGWVVVEPGAGGEIDTPPESPRLAPRRTPSSNAIPRAQMSFAARNATPSSASSVGPPRRSLIPVSRRASVAGLRGSPTVAGRSGASVAPARRSGMGMAVGTGMMATRETDDGYGMDRADEWGGGRVSTPQSAEAQAQARRYAARKKREDREADERVMKLNEQLKAMIREGKEALGTMVEVGYMDDEW